MRIWQLLQILLLSLSGAVLLLRSNTETEHSEATPRFYQRGLYVLQGSGDARYVSARLMPLQHDSPEEQLAQVPALAALSAKDRTALILQQPPTDSLSFLQWCRGHGVVLPAAPDSLTAILANMSVN